jgi:hypothetical protein
VLDVIVRTDGQPEPPLEPAPFQHLAAIGGGHALPETMHAHASTNVGLIRTFCCHAVSFNKKKISNTERRGSAGVYKAKRNYTVKRRKRSNEMARGDQHPAPAAPQPSGLVPVGG